MRTQLLNLLLLFAVCSWMISGSTSVAQTDGSLVDFLTTVPKEHSEIFAFNDPASHLEWLLANKAVRRFLESDAFRETPNGPFLQPDQLSEQLTASRPFFPEHVVLSGDESTYLTTANLLRLLYRLNMIINVSQAAVRVPPEELDVVTKEILAEVRELRVPSLCVCLQWEDESTAEQLFALISQQLSMLEQQLGLPIKSEQGAISLNIKVSDFADVDQIGQVISEWGLVDRNDEIAKAVLEIQLQIRAERIPNGIRMTLGKQFSEYWKPGELTGFQPKPNWIAMGRWNLQKLKQIAREFEAVANKWKQSELGKANAEFDIGDTTGDLESGFDMIAVAPDSGLAHAWRVDNKIRATLDLYGNQAAIPLAGNPIIELIPAEAGWFHVDSRTSFTAALAAWLNNSEGRMATQAVAAELSGNEAESRFKNDFYDGYLQHFAPWRNVMHKELPKHQLTPWAMLGIPGGQLDSLSIRLTGLSDTPVKLSNQPIPQIAAIAKLPNASEIPKLFESAFKTFAESTIRASGAEIPSPLTTTATVDLDLGLPTTEFSLKWLDEASVAQVQLTGDFRPHYVVADGFLILSTSPDITKLILDRDRKSIGLGSGADRIVARGMVTGDAMAADVTGTIALLFRGMLGPQNESRHFQGMLGIMKDMIGILNVAHWRTTQNEQSQTSEFIIELAD